jgi:hypothetical protein
MLRTMALLALALAVGCTAVEVDAVGNWNYTGTYGVGSCGLTGTNSGVITVSEGAQGFVLSSTAGAVTGSVTCSADACNMTATLAPATTITVTLTLSLSDSGAVTGTGTTAMTQPMNCSQAFTVTGSKM